MGNALGRGAAGGLRRLPKALPKDELATMNRIAAQEQERMRELPSEEELNIKDTPLDSLLNKIHGSITSQPVNIQPQEPTSVGPSPNVTLDPAGSAGDRGRGSGTELTTDQREQWDARSVKLASDDEPGRVQAYILRDLLERQNAAKTAELEPSVADSVQMHGIDAIKLRQLLIHCALPHVGKFKTFGHEYAFARPPTWWHSTGAKGVKNRGESKFLEDLEREKQERLARQDGAKASKAKEQAWVPPQLRRKAVQSTSSSHGSVEGQRVD